MKDELLLLTDGLQANLAVFTALLHCENEELIYWKPFPEKWNLLEIVCHLYDEEREDFRARIAHSLFSPREVMPSIDPQAWVNERNYGAQNYKEKVEAFKKERLQSIAYVREIKDSNWNSAYLHPKFGPMSALLFLSNWLAHDYLHIKQITRIKYEFLKNSSSSSLDYAGNW